MSKNYERIDFSNIPMSNRTLNTKQILIIVKVNYKKNIIIKLSSIKKPNIGHILQGQMLTWTSFIITKTRYLT